VAEVTEPVLDIERVLFLDARNQKFVEKTSPVTARVQDARDSLLGVVVILTFVAAVLFLAFSNHVTNTGLTKNGRLTTGVITAKIDYHKDGPCQVTYRFSAPPTAPPIYERRVDLPYQTCPTFRVGQAVEVVYDPQQPLYSNLKGAIENPRYPVWPFAIAFLGVVATLPWQISKVRRERRMCAQGQVICGSVVNRKIDCGQLEIQYSFRHPAGFTMGSVAQGDVRRSNWTNDWQFFPDKPNVAAVLFSNDTEFYLL
jgi:hypothetical protein